jgi:xanthine dehydrogenase YagR molybdenum-binding subunit
MMGTRTAAIGAGLDRVEGRAKVEGEARYAGEYSVDRIAYVEIVPSTVARGSVAAVDTAAALALPGVIEVLSHENAPVLHAPGGGELCILQSPRVAYRGQIVAAVAAESLETAREAARLVGIDYDVEAHDVTLRSDHPDLYKPEKVNPSFDTDSDQGDFDSAYVRSEYTIDETYETPAYHNNPLEPHATTAIWDGGTLTVYDGSQGPESVREALATAFSLPKAQVRVVASHVGGGFGSKGTVRPNTILAVMAARTTGRPARVSVTRRQMFTLTGYRTPTIQRLRLGADREGHLAAIAHDVVEQTSTIEEFAEQTAVPSRMMYAGESRRTSHRIVRLDVPTPSWMRAPGECPGMFALETAMDELAVACSLDPIELRVRNEPDVDPESGLPFSSRGLVACLREGAERFGWGERPVQPRGRRDGRWLTGIGVAASTYPARRRPSRARARAERDGCFAIALSATDVGTGARTALTQIAADELDVPTGLVTVELGDSSLPAAPLAGGSMGTASWGSAVVKACRELNRRLDEDPDLPVEVEADTTEDVEADAELARHAFGAQFAEVRVNADTGEIRVPRLLGAFAAGRIVNAKTARSQLLGGMTMGLSMALHEESLLDERFGDYVNSDFAGYRIASCADVEELDVFWIEEHDEHLNPIGAKGIGEIGIVGTAAAIGNAVYAATGLRVRSLPIRLDKLVGKLSLT